MVDTNKVTRPYWSFWYCSKRNKTPSKQQKHQARETILFLAIRRTVADRHCRVRLIRLPFKMYKLSEAIPVALISNCNTAHFNWMGCSKTFRVQADLLDANALRMYL